MVDQSKLASTISWLVAGAQPLKTIEAITEETAQRLCQAGVPIEALIVNGLFIHPQIRGMQITWTRRNGVRRLTYDHHYFETNAFNDTPVATSIASGRAKRLDITVEDAGQDAHYKQVFRRAGYTDALVLPLFNFDGSVNGCVEFATKAKGGFDDDQVTALRRIQSPLARMKEIFTERFDKQITLATYVGEATSRKVLSGKIVLGDGETISAVVLFADIKGFTELSNALPSEKVLEVLNRFYAAIDAALSRTNGEILKFLGDGVLAIFPTPDDLTAQEAAASGALDAVAHAREALAQQDQSPALEFRAALHIGDLFFGNIGSGSRLDFTAIGPTVNMASRMLEEASRRDAQTICSHNFKSVALGLSAERIECQFRGFDQPVEAFVLA